MNLKEPRKKRFSGRVQRQPPFPINTDEENGWKVFTAHLGVSGVSIVDPDEMSTIYSMGYYGKGSLSRSFPNFGKGKFGLPPLVRNRQWERRQKWHEEIKEWHSKIFPSEVMVNSSEDEDSQSSEILVSNSSPEPAIKSDEVLVVCDSDSDIDNYLQNVKPRIETDNCLISEILQLTFEETFFLMYGFGLLQLINYDEKPLNINDTWRVFNDRDETFFTKYIVYHYFRSKGWVVKPGLKFGGDFILYKQGPPYYHASYIVVVEMVDSHSLLRNDTKSTRKITWNNFIQSRRLAEVTAKEFMIAQVLGPINTYRQSHPIPIEALSEFTVNELLWRRWKANQSHENNALEDEDSEEYSS